MSKLIYLLFAVKTAFCSCNPDKGNGFKKIENHYKVKKIATLPAVADESSGLAHSSAKNTFWTHNDSGGKPELYEFDLTGKLLSTKLIPGANNSDWEELSEDDKGTIFVGDIGNNGNSKRSLTIYKVPPGNAETEKITFNYADQKDFPPSKDNMNFDCEALFYHDNALYLFSKNRSPVNHFVRLYKLPAEKGNYSIAPFDSIPIKTQVTSADISPDGKKFVLLTYGKILLFEIEGGVINFKKPLGCFKFAKKQSEAILFVNNNDMIVTNEQREIFRITYR